MIYRRRLLRSLSYLGTPYRLSISLLVGVVAALSVMHASIGAAELIVAWDGFAISMLVLAWARILTASPAIMMRVVRVQHVNRVILLFTLLGGACASLGAVIYLLLTKGGERNGSLPFSVVLAVLTVVCSWWLVHTVFTLHYAYLYFRMPNSLRVQAKPQGLQFPGPGSPDYLDFAYFSFVIGMTSQVSDVTIASREIRRWALLHGLIAFGFNAAILAVSVNVISGIFGPG